MRRNRVIGLALLGAFVLSGIGGAIWLTTGIEPEFESPANPASVRMAPEPERDWSKTRATRVAVPTANDDDRPWVVRGIRLWEDTGTPCNEPLEIERCGDAQLNGADPYCLKKDWSGDPLTISLPSQDQGRETGEFEIKGTGPALVFAGVQVEKGMPRSLRGQAGRAALVPVAGGDRRELILYCEPRGDMQVQVFEADGTHSDGWWFHILEQWRPVISGGTPETIRRIPAGTPIWVHAVPRGSDDGGLLKQVIASRDMVNTVSLHIDPQESTVLKGRVTDRATGQPLSPSRVVAELVGGPYGVQVRTLTDASGNYSFRLAPGTWRIRSWDMIDSSWREVVSPGKTLGAGTWTLDLTLQRGPGRE